MRVAVTGGSGQLGTLVLRRLADERKVKSIVSIDLRPPRASSGKLRSIIADVRDPGFARHLEGCDALVHLAFLVVGHAPRPVFDAINVGGSRNVFRAAAEAGVQTIVYSSSVAAYGVVPGHPIPLLETSPRVHQRDFPYAATKFEVEAFLDEFEREHPQLAIARLRPTILVGRYMEHALGTLLRRRRFPDLGPAPAAIVWDEDVADAVMLCLRQRAHGAFNLSADELLPSRELAARVGLKIATAPRWLLVGALRMMALAARLGIGKPPDQSWVAAGPGGPLVPSSEKAKQVLGWRPRCPTAVSVLERYLEEVPSRIDPPIALFLRLVDLNGRARVMPELRGFGACIHLRLDGPGGGDYTLDVAEGRVRAQAGVPRSPTATISLMASLFKDLLAGRADIASAQMTGRLRIVGQGHAGMILGGMVGAFRAGLTAGGARALVARGLVAWLERGSARPA